MNARTQQASARRQNERVTRWNNIVRILASRNDGRLVLIDLEHELKALDQSRFTNDGIHPDTKEGQAWMNLVFPEQNELDIELF